MRLSATFGPRRESQLQTLGKKLLYVPSLYPKTWHHQRVHTLQTEAFIRLNYRHLIKAKDAVDMFKMPFHKIIKINKKIIHTTQVGSREGNKKNLSYSPEFGIVQ